MGEEIIYSMLSKSFQGFLQGLEDCTYVPQKTLPTKPQNESIEHKFLTSYIYFFK
jgi:hypothetical protein